MKILQTIIILNSFFYLNIGAQEGKTEEPIKPCGIYKYQNQYLYLYDDSFLFFNKKNTRALICSGGIEDLDVPDTISLGIMDFYEDRGVVEITSTKNSDNVNWGYVPLGQTVPCEMEESMDGSPDSIYICINCPFFDGFKYYWTISSVNLDITCPTTYNTKKKVLRNKGRGIGVFYINIYPDPYFWPSSEATCGLGFVSTGFLEPDNNDVNVFNISIPELTLDFWTFRRLKQDYVLVQGDTLIWDGNKYIKTVSEKLISTNGVDSYKTQIVPVGQ